MLIGGLGVGFSLARAAAEPRWGRIAVVERERAVIDWHRTGPLAPFSGHALDDPRVGVIESDLVRHLQAPGTAYDALCLDIDNGPDWTVTDDQRSRSTPPPDSPAAGPHWPPAGCWRCGPPNRPPPSSRHCGMPDSSG